MKISARQISIGGVVAALYFAITITPGISAISYGPLQVRIAEALTILPFVYPGAIAGLFAGCLLANIFGPVGVADIVFGSLLTLIAAWLTYLLRRTDRPLLAPIPPIIINSFGVPIYLHIFFDQPYWIVALYILIGETIACYVLGYPLLKIILRKKRF
jgi:uncharacterized membrane protein